MSCSRLVGMALRPAEALRERWTKPRLGRATDEGPAAATSGLTATRAQVDGASQDEVPCVGVVQTSFPSDGMKKSC
jgi:hypothetical protein